jgi:hypothetical protein
MARDRWLDLALLAYGLLNATLYTGLLPLWEGFDEPFHYGYVQHIRTQRSLPRLGETMLSNEVWSSIAVAPASHVVQHNIPQVIAFGDYFRLPAAERLRLRERLYAVDPASARLQSDAQNYEAHQTPLAYLLLAPFDGMWRNTPLPVRVRRLRLVCAWVSVALTWIGVLALARAPVWRAVALFLVFSLQMFYASTAHVCNDWLAVPLFTLFLAAAAHCRWAGAIVMFSAGLVAKAYFLAAAPVAAFLLWKGRKAAAWALLCLVPAVAWYGRNVVLYGSLSGMQEARGGLPLATVIDAARQVPWWESAKSTARGVMWTGNNSDTSFHRRTVDGMIFLLGAGAVLFLAKKKWSPGERIVAGAVVIYVGALAFALAQSYYYTRHEQIAPSPWFVQPIYIAVVCLLVSGMAAFPRIGKVVAVAAIWMWAYVISATYWLKLIPLYGGYPYPHAQPARVWRWYTTEFPAALDATALMSSGWVLVLAAAVVAMTVGIGGWLTRRLIQSEP